ncbi:MAG: uncharacterized protein JWP00_4894 [Chloroflexi bacterium]|nr:uncharacterized protein [Chloroflexota bacterium]
MKKRPVPANKQYLWAWLGGCLVAAALAGWGLASFLGQPGAAPPGPVNQTGYRPLVGTPSVTAVHGKPGLTTPGPATGPDDRTQSPVPATSNSQTAPAAAGAIDERYGLIVTGLVNEADKIASLNRTLELSQARWWYQYTPDRPANLKPDTRQIYMVRTWHGGMAGENFKGWMQFVQETARFNRPTYWLIGNEPNTPGQDDTTPEAYAAALHEANRLIRATDPQATIIGPNILNFDDTCRACPGFTSGRAWLEQVRKIYRDRYQAELPFDVWSIHTYNLNWEKLPLIDQAQDARQLEAFRAYLDSTPATRDKPIWLTEFGVVWGYDGLEWQKDARGAWTALPRGTYRQDLLEKYLTGSLDWLDNNAARLKIERWFLFTSYGEAEGFSRTFGGIALFDSSSPAANLTGFGRIYSERIKNPPARR